MKILQDVKTAAEVFGEIRKARRAGASAVQVRPVYRVPAVRLGYFTATMEACLFQGGTSHGNTFKTINDAFKTLPEDVQHSLTFTPPPGGWAERARLWGDLLRPVLPDALYHEAMLTLLRHYSKCVRRRLGVQA